MNLGVGLALIALWLAALALSWQHRRRHSGEVDYRLDVLALGLLALAVVLFYWPVLTGVAWAPAGGGDFNSLYYPYYSFLHRALHEGALPLWNPYAFAGMPGVAYTHSSIFYPFNLLTFLFVPEFNYLTLESLGILHYFLAASFMYALGRTIGQSRFGAFVAGLIYAFSGYLIAHFGHLSQIEVTIWLPLAFLLLHRSLERRSPGMAISGGIALGASLLGGHTQVSLYMITVLTLYWLYHVGWLSKLWQQGVQWRRLLQSVALYAILMGVAAGVSAFQLMSTAELVGQTPRAEINYNIAAEYSMAPAALITLAVPHYFGLSASNHWGYWAPEDGNLTEFYCYSGIVTLVLAGLGLLLRRSRYSWFFVILAIVSLLLSFGGYTILQRITYHFVPAFNMVRVPARFISFWGFALAVLAGFGAELLLSPLPRRLRQVYGRFVWGLGGLTAAVVVIALPVFYHDLLITERGSWQFQRAEVAVKSVAFAAMLLGLTWLLLFAHRYWRWPRALVPVLLVAILVLDLFSNQTSYNQTQEDLTAGFEHPEIISFLRQDDGIFRIDSVTGVWDVWQPYTGLLYGYSDVMGVPNPLVLAAQQEYWEALGSRSSAFYDLLNVKYVIARKDVELDWQKFERVFTGHPILDVYENKRVLPRAFMVYSAQVVPDEEMVLAAIKSQSFDPRETVLLQKGTPLAGQPRQARVEFQRYGMNEMLLAVDTPADGYLVLSEMTYPGWEARVGGQPREVLRANHALRAIYLPAGSHIVEITFAPASWRLGWIATAITWLAVAGYAVYSWRSPRLAVQPRPQPATG